MKNALVRYAEGVPQDNTSMFHYVSGGHPGHETQGSAVDDPAAIERRIQDLAAQGTDGAIYEAQALARRFGVRSPSHRDFNEPPSAEADTFGPSGRPRPLMRGPDYSGFTGGPDDPHAGKRGVYEEDRALYEELYRRIYGPPNRR